MRRRGPPARRTRAPPCAHRAPPRRGACRHVPLALLLLPRPCSTALTAASTRERMPSLRRIALTCSLTVPSVISQGARDHLVAGAVGDALQDLQLARRELGERRRRARRRRLRAGVAAHEARQRSDHLARPRRCRRAAPPRARAPAPPARCPSADSPARRRAARRSDRHPRGSW